MRTERTVLWRNIVVAMMIPVVTLSIFLFVGEGHHVIWDVMPSWNDEDFYYNQIKSVLQYGHPLGYYGYDGSHAALGNFGAHGWFIEIPQILFCFITGEVRFWSFAVANLVMYTIAMVVWIICHRPDIRDVLWGGMIFFTPMLAFYSTTAMMEGVLYFWAILSAILLGKLALADLSADKRWIHLALLSILLASLSKVTWSILFFPFFLMLFSRRFRPLIKVLLSMISTGVITCANYLIYRLFSAEYFSGAYFIDTYMEILRLKGMGALWNICQMFGRNVVTTFFQIYEQQWIEISKWFIIIVFLLAGAYLFSGHSYSYVPIMVLAGAVVGVIGLYSKEGFAIRTISPIAVFSLMYMIVIPGEKYLIICLKRITLVAVFLMTLFVQHQWGFDYRFWYSEADEQKYEQIEEQLSVIEIKKDTDPWNNTVAVLMGQSGEWYPDRIVELFLPAGVGINYYRTLPENMSDFEPRYILLRNDATEMIECLVAENFVVLDADINGAALLGTTADGIATIH